MLEMGVVLPTGEQEIKAGTVELVVLVVLVVIEVQLLEKFRSEVVVEGGQLLVTKCSHILFSLYYCYRNRQHSSLKLNGHAVTGY